MSQKLTSRKKIKSRSGGRLRQQYAALPVRMTEAGEPEILLVTSRGTQRWIIPKGWPMRRLTPGQAAAREAYEEAGLEGEIDAEQPIGSYLYEKRMGNGNVARIEVSIFLLRVSRQLAAWPEQAERETRWFNPTDASRLVAEPDLAIILRDIQEITVAGSLH